MTHWILLFGKVRNQMKYLGNLHGGKGRPGWHIECSTMILANLGQTIDIHGGGKDLVFPHHENEIAQSEALTGKPLAQIFSHSGLVKINGQKMSKSLGNTLTIKQALAKYNKEVIRYAMLEKHYSSDIDLTDELFALAERQLYYFYKTIMHVGVGVLDNPGTIDIEKEFIDAMDDDFNTAKAISNIFTICKYLNTNPSKEIKDKLVKTYEILGLLQQNPQIFINELKDKYLTKLGINKNEIDELVNKRTEAKNNKDFETADKIRKELTKKGILLNDSKEGTNWDIEELFSNI